MKATAMIRKHISHILAEYILDNPVLTKDLRTRMRGRRAFLIMGGYVLFLAIVMLISTSIVRSYGAHTHSMIDQNIGQLLFVSLTWTQTILLALIIPALTSGALTSEIEKNTMEMMALTRLTPGAIVLGKQLSGVLYSFMLQICSLPLAGMCIMYGGISPAEVAVTYLLMAVWIFFFASIGVFWSSMFQRSVAATLMSYANCGGYLMLTSGSGAAFSFGMIVASHYGGGTHDVHPLAGMNPSIAPLIGLSWANICGIHIPLALIATVLHLALGALLLFIAVSHVKYHRTERAPAIRVMAIFITAALTWLIVGDQSIQSVQSDIMALIITASIVIFAILGIATSLFATGPVMSSESPLAYILSPRKIFKSDLRGGIGFTALWGAIVYGIFGATFLWASKAFGIKITHNFWAAYFQCGVSVIAVLVGIAAFGVLISSITSLRRNAVALTILFTLIIMFGYLIVLAQYQEGISNPRSPIWQLAAFWPITPLASLSSDWMSGMPRFWWPKQLAWLVVSLVYFGLTAAALSVVPKALSKYGGVEEE